MASRSTTTIPMGVGVEGEAFLARFVERLSGLVSASA
jgi:hypothetical protein